MIHVYFLDEDRPEIELNHEDLLEMPSVRQGFLWITFLDKSIRMINASLISEITASVDKEMDNE